MYISDAARQLSTQPRALYNSKSKVALMAVFMVVVGCAPVLAVESGALDDRFQMPALGLAALAALFFLLRIVPKLGALSRPVVTISVEGLSFARAPLIRWEEMSRNEWRTLGLLGITTGAKLVVSGPGVKVMRDVYMLAVSSKEYLRLCALYRDSAAIDETRR